MLTKATNAREETVAAEYRNFINLALNKELPDALKINLLHYDVKAKKKKVKNFPYDLFKHVQLMLDKTKFFLCFPCHRLPYDGANPDRSKQRNLCRIQI